LEKEASRKREEEGGVTEEGRGGLMQRKGENIPLEALLGYPRIGEV